MTIVPLSGRSNPATQRNVEQLRADGISVLGPAAGEQACGETGDGRMLEAHELLTDLIAFFQPKLLAGRHVLLTAGPTSEPVDPVRVLSNRSSGKTGYALARAAREAGARVTLISGATFLPVPRGFASAGPAHFVHVNLAWLMIALVVIHIAAALKHHFFDRDDILARMLPTPR